MCRPMCRHPLPPHSLSHTHSHLRDAAYASAHALSVRRSPEGIRARGMGGKRPRSVKKKENAAFTQKPPTFLMPLGLGGPARRATHKPITLPFTMRSHLRNLATLASKVAARPPPPLPPAAADAVTAASRSRARLRSVGYLCAVSGGLGCGAMLATTSGRRGEGGGGGGDNHSSRAVAATASEAPSLPARLLLTVARAASDAVSGYTAQLPAPTPLPTERLRCARGDTSGGRARGTRPPIVLVACGSFNPPTVAHVRMFDVAEAALREVREGGGGGEVCLSGWSIGRLPH